MDRPAKDSSPQIAEFDLLQNVINAVPTPIFYKNAKGQYIGCNTAFEHYVGMSKQELIGYHVFELFEPELAEVYHQADQALLNSGGKQIYEARVKFADGSYHDVMFHKAILNTQFPELNGVVGAILDITERKDMERQLRAIAHTDSLTRVANRYFIIRELENILKDKHLKYAVYISIDLDDFKQVNDTYGHPAGDKLLVQFSKRLKQMMGQRGLVARIGGDEFAILLTERRAKADKTPTELIESIMQPLMHMMNEEIILGTNKRLTIGYSIGATLIEPNKHNSIEKVLQRADSALYKAKREGKGGWSL